MLHVINVTFSCASSEVKEKSFPLPSTSCSAVYLVDRHCKLLADVAVIFPAGFIKAFCRSYCCAHWVCKNIRAEREETARLKLPNKPMTDWD